MIAVLLSQIWVQRLGWALLHFLWQGTAIAIVYAVLRGALARVRSFSPRGRYGLACAALVAMTVAPALTYLAIPNSAAGVSWTISPAESQRLLTGVVTLWLAGVMLFSIRLIGGWRFTARLRATAHPAAIEWQRRLEQIARRIGASQPVRLLVSSLVEVPTVIGWLRPVILVPVEFLAGVPAGHITALLAHEIAHIRRHDYLASILQSVAEAVLFYHPAVWWISGQIRAERELCCDDLAVAVTGDALAYARALADLETRQRLPMTPALAANGGSLVKRIRRLIEAAPITNDLPGPAAAWAMTLLWLAGVGVAAMHSAQSPVHAHALAHVVEHRMPVKAVIERPSPFAAAVTTARKTLMYDPLLAAQVVETPVVAAAPSSVAEEAVKENPTVAGNVPELQALVIQPAPIATISPEPRPVGERFPEAQPSPEPIFHAATKLVLVDVVAKGKRGAASALTGSDFTLLDNGKPQKISVFSVSPGEAAGIHAAPLAKGAVSNRLERDGETWGNATVILLDQKNTPQVSQAFAIQRIEKFFQTREVKDRQQDRIGIYTFLADGSLHVVQELTRDAESLRVAAKSLKARDPSRRHVSDASPGDEDPLQVIERATDTSRAMEGIARHLASVPGRKSLIWVTASFPLMPQQGRELLADFNPDMQAAARALTDANVGLYAVDARGLIGSLSGMTAIFNAEFGGAQSPLEMSPAGFRRSGYTSGLASGIDTMFQLADLTGGLVFYGSNGIEDSIQKALDDAELTYTIGFYPGQVEPDGTWHKLKLKVAKPGVKVRYREKYYASQATAGPDNRADLLALLNGPLDATQLQLVAQTTPDRARPGFRQVRVSVDLHDVHLENQNNKWVGAVDVSFLIDGAQTARRIAGKVSIPDQELAAALEEGIAVNESIAVGGGTAGLRIVAQDRATGAAGSVRVPLGR